MIMYDIIDKKRYGKELTKEEIEFFVNGYVKNEIPDYQMSSLLMAICINGMTDEELGYLTIAMTDSGNKLDLSNLNGITVDKHSTGGVGDKTTLVVAPIVASLGCKVAKMSGRGLGFTGGTVDKLEAIEGYNVNITEQEFFDQVRKIGISLIGQTDNLTPADKKIYSLRDVTATVESIPLIASSIMCKKLAAGSECILLDVTVGSGAFMKNVDDATNLAKKMVNIGKIAGRKTMAVITNMDIPLGNKIGNILEVEEAIDVLKGKGPKDLTKVCIELATYMLMLCTKNSKQECQKKVESAIKDGRAFNKFKELVIAQGGNVKLIENPDLFNKSKYEVPVVSKEEGYITKMDTAKVGRVATLLGAGRQTKEDTIDPAAGIVLNKKTGDFVKAGDVIAKLHTSKENIEEFKNMYLDAIEFSKTKPEEEKLIFGVIE